MRHYLPGLGRFISRVRLHEAVAMGKTAYQELREVWGINIGPLGTPEAFEFYDIEYTCRRLNWRPKYDFLQLPEHKPQEKN